MKFEHVNAYDAPSADVYTMLTDQAFREKVCAVVKSQDYTVKVDSSGEQVTVDVDQTQRVRKVPSFAAKLVGETVQIRQVERWTTPTAANLELTIPGKPGQLRGAIALQESGGRTTHSIRGDLKVSIPLVGGKLEGLIAGLLNMFMDAEQKVGTAWLDGDR
jgi:Protein of unknown function (DUF2505)